MLSPNYLDRAQQEALLADIHGVIAQAPLYTPYVPSGAPMSVRMTNCGSLGWVTDARGYRYEPTHPITGKPWPPIPAMLIAAWRDLAGDAPLPEACLVNYYGPDARMGLHQDRDEDDFTAPVVSLSLGDTCIFRLGGATRKDPTKSFRLASGDAMILAGSQRLAFHGVDRIIPGSSTLLPDGGRINLTLRRVTRPS
jgi:DNA oxidative demethylase